MAVFDKTDDVLDQHFVCSLGVRSVLFMESFLVFNELPLLVANLSLREIIFEHELGWCFQIIDIISWQTSQNVLLQTHGSQDADSAPETLCLIEVYILSFSVEMQQPLIALYSPEFAGFPLHKWLS